MPQIIRLPQNRVNVVYQINDGPSTLISKIAFVGNKAFSEDRLSEVINSREERWWRFLSSSDEYNPERLELRQGAAAPVLPEERLYRFRGGRRLGRACRRTASRSSSPSRSTKASATGSPRSPSIRSSATCRAKSLRRDLKLQEGDWYDGDAVGRSSDAIEDDVRSRGFAFVDVKPRVEPDRAKHTMRWPSTWARGRASMSSGSTSSAIRAPRTR